MRGLREIVCYKKGKEITKYNCTSYMKDRYIKNKMRVRQVISVKKQKKDQKEKQLCTLGWQY